LRPAILSLPPHGCVNVHASLLPRYRGPSPIPMAILAGDTETGVTIMLMDEGADTGPILAQRAIPIEDHDTTGTLTAKLAALGAQLLVETLPAWVRGEITPQPQDERQATYCQKWRKEDGRIDWSAPAGQIWRQVRAFQPWPGAYTFWAGNLLKILEVWPIAEEKREAPAGHVVDVAGEPAVVAGDGLVVLKKVQLAGKKPMEGTAFVRGQRGFVGSMLDGQGR